MLYFDNGELRHAEQSTAGSATLDGEDAVYELLTWSNGRFHVQKEIKPPTITVQQSWSFLLMEGLHRRDERDENRFLTSDDESLRDPGSRQGKSWSGAPPADRSGK